MGKARNDYDVTRRLLSLVEKVDREESLRLSDIQAAWGVGYDTARQYVQFVQEVRPGLVEVREAGGSKAWREAATRQPAKRDHQVAAALEFAHKALLVLEGTPHFSALKMAAEAARNRLGARAGTLDRLSRSFLVRPVERPRGGERSLHLREIMEALERRHACAVRYERLDGRVQEYEIEPWAFVYHRDELFLLAGKRVDGSRTRVRRLFTIDGIQRIRQLGPERFRPPILDAEDIFRFAIGVYAYPSDERSPVDVHLRVRGEQAVRLRRRQIHPSQTLTEGAGGWWEVHLRVTPCPQLTSRILSMLPDVMVLAPRELAAEVRGKVQAWLGVIDA